MPDTALLVIDMQRALLKGAHDGEACLARVAGLAARARAADVPVVYLRQRLADVPIEWLEVHPALTPRPGDVVLDKRDCLFRVAEPGQAHRTRPGLDAGRGPVETPHGRRPLHLPIPNGPGPVGRGSL
ncbi:isochorismatase family protein [Streptomyces humi]